MKLTERQKQDLCKVIEECLLGATLDGLHIEDEQGKYPLLDFLQHENGVAQLNGKNEINNLVEQIYEALDDYEL